MYTNTVNRMNRGEHECIRIDSTFDIELNNIVEGAYGKSLLSFNLIRQIL